MVSKAELEKQRDEINAQIDVLYARLKPITDALEEIKANEKGEAISALNKKYGVIFEIGKEFIVTDDIQSFAKSRGFGQGYYPGWQIGQKARILSIDPYSDVYQIRAECDTGHTYRQGIGLNDEQRNEQIKLFTPNAPIPIELIAEALLNGI